MKITSLTTPLLSASLLLFLLFVSSCSKVEDPASGTDETGLANRAVVATVDNGVAHLIVDPADLTVAFREGYGSENADDFSVQEVEGDYYLQGMLVNPDQTRTTFAVQLELLDDGDLGFDPLASIQSCTSSTNCKGCSLTVLSSNAGYCDCVKKQDEWGGAGRCHHSVKIEAPSVAGEGKMDTSDGSPALKRVIAHLNR